MNYFYYLDPIRSEVFHEKYKYLSIKHNEDEQLLVTRLFSGNIDIIHKNSNTKIKQRIDNTTFPAKVINVNSRYFDNFIEGIKTKDLNNYFYNVKYKNKKFYNSILNELSNYYYQRNRNSFTTSFIYAYRLLEAISYGFPLIYASKTKDFEKSYKALNSFFSKNEKAGELAFFRQFLNVLFKDTEYLELTVDVDLRIENIDFETRKLFYEIFRKTIDKERYIVSETENTELQFKFLHFFNVIISLRNKYFHFLKGGWQENITSLEMIEPDLFFSIINDKIINWIGLVFFQILQFSNDNYI